MNCSIKINKTFKLERVTKAGNSYFVEAKVVYKTEKAVLIEWSDDVSMGSVANYKGVSLNCKESFRTTTFTAWCSKSIFCDIEKWTKQEIVYATDWRGNVCFHDEDEKFPVIQIEGGFRFFTLPFWIDYKEKN